MDPPAKQEQCGRRPALVLSRASCNIRVGLALIVAITSQVKGYPFEVLPPHGHRIKGAVFSDQIKSVDWRKRRATLICALPDDVIRGNRAEIGGSTGH